MLQLYVLLLFMFNALIVHFFFNFVKQNLILFLIALVMFAFVFSCCFISINVAFFVVLDFKC